VTSQAERTPPVPARPSRETDDRDAFAEIFDAHARHIFDYCHSLLADQARAASATQVTLVAAHSLASRLNDAGRMRAFVLALARRECLSGAQVPAGAATPGAASPPGPEDLAAALAFVDQSDDGIGDADPGELTLSDFETSSGLSLRKMLEALPREDREILDLLYRHDVGMADLAALLGVPAASVPRIVAAAKSKLAAKAREMSRQAADGQADPDVRPEQLSAVRLAALPASIWRRTARVVMDPRFSSYRDAVRAHAEHLGPDGFPVQSAAPPSGRRLVLASALMAGLLLAPAAAGGVGYAAFSAISHVVDHERSIAVTPGGPTSGGSATGGPGAGGAHAGRAKRTGSNGNGDPAAGQTLGPGESSSPHKSASSSVPTSRYSLSSSPKPSQSSTSPGGSTTSPAPSTPPPSSPAPPTSSPTSAATAGATSGSTTSGTGGD